MADNYDQQLIDRGCKHEIHVSESRSFRACRRRWHWHFRENYNPVVTPKPLEFGSAYHMAMETLHNPSTWHFEPDVLGALAEKVFVEECWRQKKEYLRARDEYALEGEQEENYEERVDLGRGMLRYYVKAHLPQLKSEYTPTHVETSFDVLLLDANDNTIYCKCDNCRSSFARTGGGRWRGNPVVFSGRVDMIVHDSQGFYHVWDWKHLHVSTRVLTPTGWVRMQDLSEGQQVVGRDGKATTILGCSEVTQQEEYEVLLTDMDEPVRCSPSHKWTVYDQANRLTTLATTDLAKAPHAYGIPIVEEAQLYSNSEELYIPAYAMGALLADGGFDRELSFASKSGETAELLSSYLPNTLRLVDNRKHGNNKWSIQPVELRQSNAWKEALKRYCLWGRRSADKFIPEQYLFTSVENRIALLQGLYDGDGLASKRRICTTSKRLAEDIRTLIRSLGGTAGIAKSTRRMHTNGTTVNEVEYFINFWVPETVIHCQLSSKRAAKQRASVPFKRQIKSVRKTGQTVPMRCIAVDAPDNLYVVEGFVATHNTTAAMAQQEVFLELDDQVARYLWALRHRLGLNIRSFIYFEIRKAFPEPPAENKTVRLGRRFSVNRNQATDYETYRNTVANEDTAAYEEGLYDDFLSYLKASGPEYFRKFVVYKSEYELEEIGRNLLAETLDMLDPNLRLYPSPGRFACGWCPYQVPCISKNSGQDYEYTLQTLYEVKPPYYLRRLSTDRSQAQ